MARLITDDALAVITIFQEARGEIQDGKVAVAEVIRNRMTRRYQSDGTVAGTVARAFQFSGWNPRDPNRVLSLQIDDADATVAACQSAWRTAQSGSDLTRGAVLYYNPIAVLAKPEWVSRCVEVAVIGRHHFFVPNDWS